MDSQQAKFILQAYRPGGQDANDPQFAEALEQVHKDPELAKWFAEERAFDEAIGSKLKSIPVPADLKLTILAGQKVIRPQAWWKKSRWVAAAACLAMVIGAIAVWVHAISNFSHYRRDMAGFLRRMESLDHPSNDIDDVKHWLDARCAHGCIAIASNLEKMPVEGCSMLRWHGKDVVLICFQPNTNKTDEEVHLLAIESQALRQGPGPGEIQYSEYGGWSTASWTDGVQVFLLAGKIKQAELKQYVPQTYCK